MLGVLGRHAIRPSLRVIPASNLNDPADHATHIELGLLADSRHNVFVLCGTVRCLNAPRTGSNFDS
jgi:hypothetical protein